jgi:anthranilate phosphoribosyltransferase
VVECAEEAGIAFCFAPRFHPALRHAAVTRRELGVATVFNFLGPLANPASPRHQAVGVADARMAGVMAAVLAARGVSALVFRGEDGLDELTTADSSRIWLVRDGSVSESSLHPAVVGLSPGKVGDLRGGDAAHNAEVARALLAGAQGPVRDAVLLNAAAALVSLDIDERPLPEQLSGGMQRAAEAIVSGAAQAALHRWVETSQRLAAR